MDTEERAARRSLERRWAPRYPFRADLEIEWGSAVLAGKTRDISASGMFIEAADTLWVGAGFSARLNLSPRGDLKEAAANLFAMLRELDKSASLIAVSPIPDYGLGEAINDRLQRAAAPRTSA